MSIWASSTLCEEEIDELRKSTVFEVFEIEALYERFKYLDRPSCGFLSFVDFQLIPEFYSNPFCNLIIGYLEKINSFERITFASYLEFLSLFNAKTATSRRVSFLFSLFDLEKDKKITRDCLRTIHGMMNGPSNKTGETSNTTSVSSSDKNPSTDEQIEEVLDLFDVGKKGYLDQADFEGFYSSDPNLEKNMLLDISRLATVTQADGDFLDMIWPSRKN